MLRKLLIIAPIFILFILALAFGSQNSQFVELNYLVARAQLSVASIVVIFLLTGFLLGSLAMLSHTLKLRWQLRKLRKQLQRIERAQPSSD